MKKIVIIGGVAGGASAAARIRRLDEQAEIIMLERSGYVSYANSIAVSPWGDILARAGAEETTLYVELDPAYVESIRAQLPLMSARRTDMYRLERI